MPKISIITVTYNSDLYLEQAIVSVLSQTYPAIEYIIIDGNSTDNTKNIIQQYISKIAKYISEPDRGIYDAMNKGIKLATGEIIGILNSDDLYIDNNVLTNVMECFMEDPELDIVYSDLVYVKQDDIEKVVRLWRSKSFCKNYFEHGNVPAHPTLFLRKRVYDKAGFFNLDFSLAADYEFMLRIFKRYNFKSKYINRVTIRMRLGGATSKDLKNILRQNIEIIRSWKINKLSPPIFLMHWRLLKKLQQFIY